MLWVTHHHYDRTRQRTSRLCALTHAIELLFAMEIDGGRGITKLFAMLDPGCRESA